MKNLTLITTITINFFLITVNLFSQACLPEGITFTTQAQIDSFQINYPNCTEIEGSLSMGSSGGTDIINLNGLSVLTSIEGSLQIGYWYLGNPILQSLSGLDNLTYIGGSLDIHANAMLQNLTGLDNLTYIGGDITIGNGDYKSINSGVKVGNGNPSLKNLEGLENLIYVGGSLSTQFNDSLTSFMGLGTLDSIGGIITSDPITSLAEFSNLSYIGIDGLGIHHTALTSLTGLENVTSIAGDVFIDSNDSLICLTGLENLVSINGNLIIGGWDWQSSGNPSLLSLAELGNLVSVGGNLIIDRNASLTSLTGLENLTNVEGGNIEIGSGYSYWGYGGNTSLISLEGLGNIDANSIGNLSVKFNNSLSTCDVQSICDYLSNPGGEVEIHNNAPGCNNPAEIANVCGFQMPCLPFGNYYFTSQEDVDSFQVYYPNCLDLQGDVTICENDIGDIINLSGLYGINSIGDELSIFSNELLTSLAGMNSLQTIGGNLNIGSFYIGGNPSLTNLTGLEGLTSIGGNLWIVGFNGLVSLQGIENINAETIQGLVCFDNPTLSTCEIQSVCDYLVSPQGWVNIYDNAPGCNSPDEVEEACWTFVDEINSYSNFTISPNPFSNKIIIEFDLEQPEMVTIIISNHLGQQVELLTETKSFGKQKIEWDCERLPAGIYFCVLKSSDGIQTKKIVKIR